MGVEKKGRRPKEWDLNRAGFGRPGDEKLMKTQ